MNEHDIFKSFELRKERFRIMMYKQHIQKYHILPGDGVIVVSCGASKIG